VEVHIYVEDYKKGDCFVRKGAQEKRIIARDGRKDSAERPRRDLYAEPGFARVELWGF